MAKSNESNLVAYEEWKPEQAVGAAAAVDAMSGGGNYWKPKAGKNRIRILPTRRGLHPAPLVETWNHFIEIPGLDYPVGFNCPRRMKAGWVCEACVKLDELRKSGNPADYDAAGQYVPKLRVYANIIDRADEDAGPQVFAFGKMVYEPLMSYRSTDPAEDIPFTNINDTGCDVIIEKKGEKLKTDYTVRLAQRQGSVVRSPLHQDASKVEEWMGMLRDLRPEAKVFSAKEIHAKLMGEDRKKGRDGSGRGAVTTTGAPARGGARSVVDDMEDDDDNGGEVTTLHPDD